MLNILHSFLIEALNGTSDTRGTEPSTFLWRKFQCFSLVHRIILNPETVYKETSGEAGRRRWTKGGGTSTVQEVKHKMLHHARTPYKFSYVYTYVQVKRRTTFKIQFNIQFYIPVLLRIYIYHHHLKAITHIKHSLDFAIRQLCDAVGDPQRLWTPDERRRSTQA